jgi:acetate kinase
LALVGVSNVVAGKPGTGAGSQPVVLALNSGSSSLKFGLYRVTGSGTEELFSGAAEAIGDRNGKFQVRDGQGTPLTCATAPNLSQQDAIIRVGKLLDSSNMPAPVAIGHRIVHGGARLLQHCLIDDSVMQQLKSAAAFAPLHTPSALSGIGFAQEHFPGLPQVACFDTTFHAAMPDVARVLPIPQDLRSLGIQRYGFHGLSCESIVNQLGTSVPERLIIAHLGNGASVTAVRCGKSIDTSMGLTPSGGVMMGSRSGDLDPGVLLYLLRERKFDAVMLEDLIDHRSGLAGVSGIGSDMRRLHAAASSNPDARLAINMFCYSVRKQIAAMMAVLGGVDLVVFTGGIGENDGEVRASICAGLSWAGVSLDDAWDHSSPNPGKPPVCRVMVLPSREEEQIARHTGAIACQGSRV